MIDKEKERKNLTTAKTIATTTPTARITGQLRMTSTKKRSSLVASQIDCSEAPHSRVLAAFV